MSTKQSQINLIHRILTYS